MTNTEQTLLDCGHAATPRGVSAGYALNAQDKTLCYACADAEHRAELADKAVTRSSVYVSSDGKSITTWTGGVLGRVIASRPTRRRSADGEVLRSIYARTPDGRCWYGLGQGEGTLLNIRLTKG